LFLTHLFCGCYAFILFLQGLADTFLLLGMPFDSEVR
jgi:hypothetical protein